MSEDTIKVKLADGTDVELRPSITALRQLSSEGGLEGAAKRCRSVHFDTILSIFNLGLGQSRDLPDMLYRTGLANLVQPCLLYLDLLANGGTLPPQLMEKQEQ